jgi:ribonuclease P protein component
MRRGEEFRQTVRSGVRAATPTLVIHAESGGDPDHVRVGFVVSKAVGSAVRRNRVKRRLRHLALKRLADSPRGVQLVIRALPRAASSPQQLPDDFSSAWTSALARLDCP